MASGEGEGMKGFYSYMTANNSSLELVLFAWFRVQYYNNVPKLKIGASVESKKKYLGLTQSIPT